MKYIQILAIFYVLQRQKNIRHLSWMKRFLERLLQIINAPARLANVINVFQQAVGGEDQAYLVITKSDLTAPIEEADKNRDNTYSGFNSMLDAKRRLGTAEEQAAAERVIERVNYHKVSISDKYEDESEKIAQLVQDLKSGSLATDISTLGLTAIITLLEQQNQQVISLMMQRQSDRSTQEIQIMAKARAACDAAFEDAVMVLNAFAVTEFNGQSSPYDAIIRTINSDIAYYQQYVFTNGTASSGNGGTGNQNENDNENENPGGGTTPTTPDSPDTPENPETPDTPDPGTGGGGDTGGSDNGGGDIPGGFDQG